METISFRPLTLADYDAAKALWETTEGMGLGESDSRCGIEKMLTLNPGLSFAGVDSATHQLIGTVLAGHDGRRATLYHLAVAKPFRRRGVGRQLVERAFEGLRREGIAKCNLLIFADNTEGRKFWQSLGWSERGDLVFMQRGVEGQPVVGRVC